METPIALRDATTADLPALTAIRSSEAHHRGRLRDAQNPDFRYLVILRDQTIVGFVCLAYRRPSSWLNADNTQHLPQIVDLHIDESERGRGYGSAAMRLTELIVAQAVTTSSISPSNHTTIHAPSRSIYASATERCKPNPTITSGQPLTATATQITAGHGL